MLRFKILQVRVKHPKEKIDVVGRLRNFENPFVILLIRKSNSQGQFFCDEIDRAQSQRKLLQKPAQHKEKRLGRFDLVFEFEALVERLRRSDKLEQPIGLPIRPFPHSDGFRPKPRGELFFIKRRELTDGVDSPFVQDREDLLNLSLSILRSFWQIRALHALKLNIR